MQWSVIIETLPRRKLLVIAVGRGSTRRLAPLPSSYLLLPMENFDEERLKVRAVLLICYIAHSCCNHRPFTNPTRQPLAAQYRISRRRAIL